MNKAKRLILFIEGVEGGNGFPEMTNPLVAPRAPVRCEWIREQITKNQAEALKVVKGLRDLNPNKSDFWILNKLTKRYWSVDQNPFYPLKDAILKRVKKVVGKHYGGHQEISRHGDQDFVTDYYLIKHYDGEDYHVPVTKEVYDAAAGPEFPLATNRTSLKFFPASSTPSKRAILAAIAYMMDGILRKERIKPSSETAEFIRRFWGQVPVKISYGESPRNPLFKSLTSAEKMIATVESCLTIPTLRRGTNLDTMERIWERSKILSTDHSVKLMKKSSSFSNASESRSLSSEGKSSTGGLWPKFSAVSIRQKRELRAALHSHFQQAGNLEEAKQFFDWLDSQEPDLSKLEQRGSWTTLGLVRLKLGGDTRILFHGEVFAEVLTVFQFVVFDDHDYDKAERDLGSESLSIHDYEKAKDDLSSLMVETIRKVKGGYRLLSRKGKNLGTYPTRAGAEKRERQVQYFKHKKKSG